MSTADGEKMGEGEEVKTKSETKVEIQERGEIFFFLRPKINREEVHSWQDVQRLYIVLRPESGEKAAEVKQASNSGKEGKSESGNKGSEEGGHGKEEVNIEKQSLLRFLVMGRKGLPDPSSQRSRPYWGFVEMVTTRIEDIKNALKGDEYDTAKRGHRHKPPASAVGEGVYRILRHDPGKRVHTHLIYKLELPPDGASNKPQESLNIEREGSFIIQIKNPEQGAGSSGFAGLQTKRKAAFPAHLQACFGHRRFRPADPPDFLNYEGCEFLLIAASDDIEQVLGFDIKTECGEADASCSDLIQMFGETASPQPLLRGTWE